MNKEMYYKRVIPDKLKNLLMNGGQLRWLYNLVKERDDLDFLIGANNSQEWISVYCGTTKLLKIVFLKGDDVVNISAHHKYLDLAKKNLNIYGDKNVAELDFEADFVQFVSFLHQNHLQKHYDNRKEGYFQNLFSKQFGILSNGTEDFVVVDKEAVIGYQNENIKSDYFGKQRKKFKKIYDYLSIVNPKDFGRRLGKKALGNEVDFLAANRNGEVLLIEFKHGSSTKGIYLSPIQIGLYDSIFHDYIRCHKQDFIENVGEMIKQKKDMGLISQNFPEVKISGKIVPWLIIAEYNPRSSALNKLRESLKICRDNFKDVAFLSDLEVYGYSEDEEKGLERILI